MKTRSVLSDRNIYKKALILRDKQYRFKDLRQKLPYCFQIFQKYTHREMLIHPAEHNNNRKVDSEHGCGDCT